MYPPIQVVRWQSPGLQRRTATSIQIGEFVLGSEHFAIDLFDVKEVVEHTTITKLPNVPAYVRGIIYLRGEITMIIDLKHRLNITEKSATSLESSRIIVLDDKIAKSKIRILVDDVISVSTFEGRQVDYSSASISKESTCIMGIIKHKVRVKDKDMNDLIIWLDIKQLFGDIDASL
ncbi:MAG: chemotaxis protein CheW [Methanoregula sp.]